MAPSRTALRAELRGFLKACQTPRLRTMRQFAEDEIIIPTGPFKDLAFRCERQPASAVYFDLVESRQWNRVFATGPSQAGKSLTCFIIPTLYHLFEMKETVICGIPMMKMAYDKWTQDLLPVINRTRYKSLLPKKGQGSRGGEFDSITFDNGATLRFMSGGGDDKNRASYTSRVVIITEVDGMDEAGGTSDEADKISQIEARTNSYDDQRMIYGECTLTTPEGRTYDEINKGTATKLMCECPHCHGLVSPDREDLTGWQDADNEIDAGLQAAFQCPECAALWTDAERIECNRHLIPMHRGQEVDEDGYIVGDPPKTMTLGFRFNAFNNLLTKPSSIGREEWKASRDVNSENAEKRLRQFFWALPYIADRADDTPLDALSICARTASTKRRVLPAGTLFVSAAIDLGKWLDHWVAVAWLADGTCQVIDYGVIKVYTAELGPERAQLKALREFREIEKHGWENSDGTRRRADRVLVDSGYQTDEVYLFVAESGQGRYWASDGRGQSTRKAARYNHPAAITNQIQLIGEQYHVTLLQGGVYLLAMNADHWKSWAHKRLSTPLTTAGAMTLWNPDKPNDHLEFAKHQCAEKLVETFVVGKPPVQKWIRTHRKNHWLDALYLACVGGNLAGYRLNAPPKIEQPAAPAAPPPVEDTGRPFVRQPVKKEESAPWFRRRGT